MEEVAMAKSVSEEVLVGSAGQLARDGRASGPTRTLLERPHMRVLLIDLQAGRELSPHRPDSDLVLAVLDGMGQLLAGEEVRPVRAGDLAVVRAGVPRGLRCLEGRLVALGVVTPPPGAGDHLPLGDGSGWPKESEVEDPVRVIHEEHVHLLEGIAELGRLAQAVPALEAGELGAALAATVGFLRTELLPHADGEERLVYPAVERVLRARGGATSSMALDHRRIAELTADLERTAGVPVAALDRAAAQRLLQALSAVVSLHFDKEEEDYLPRLRQLGSRERGALVAALRGEAEVSDAG
jgi:quercetin dioxygenase-like cupin family protein/hemerythrin-like domain-containing protein